MKPILALPTARSPPSIVLKSLKLSHLFDISIPYLVFKKSIRQHQDNLFRFHSPWVHESFSFETRNISFSLAKQFIKKLFPCRARPKILMILHGLAPEKMVKRDKGSLFALHEAEFIIVVISQEIF
jgi:hypothetical protein